MIKKYVLDTNVILHDPESIYKFDEHEVILPITVVEELDKFKTDMKEVGKNARHFFAKFDNYMDDGDLKKGIVINDKGGVLRVDVRYTIEVAGVDLPLDYNIMDNRIMNCAYINDAIIVSNDRALRVKAKAYGISSQLYKNDRIVIDDEFTGFEVLTVPFGFVDRIYGQKIVSAEGFAFERYSNKYLLLNDEVDEKKGALVIYDDVMDEFNLLVTDDKIMGIEARNMEQYFALNALCDPDIKLVTLVGKAGCGKSLMALAAGLHSVTQGKQYTKLVVYRPIVPMGNDIGFLPGTKEEKLGPWMQAISDNIDFIMGDINAEDRPKVKKPRNATKHDIPILDDGKNGKNAAKISPTAELQQWGILDLECGTYIRGRSIPCQYLIVDEAQNLTPHEIKTIITRAGEGTKVVLTGDPSQIDCPYLDPTNNGLIHVAMNGKEYAHAAHIKFSKSERSELAEWAADNL